MTKYAIDLFSGTGSATKYFRQSEHWVCQGVDINPEKEEDIQKDILELKLEDIKKDVDFVWASPPCKSFSIANLYNNWEKRNERLQLPKSQKSLKGVRMVFKTLYLIQNLEPDYWFMENPRGGMRSIIGEPQKHRRDKNKPDRENPGTVTYCQYGDNRMKPTDLWGEHPDAFEYRFCGNGEDCHQSTGRGSLKGTQGRNKGAERWRLPDGLAKHVFETVNNTYN